MTDRDRLHFLLLNVGHFLDHMFTLIFATVAALALMREWGMSYGDLLKYATPGFFAFGLFAYPAGWIADKWSREGMMVVFFAGIGAGGDRDRLRADAVADRHRAVRDRRVRRDLSSGRPGDCRREMEEHRHAHRRERRLGQSRRRERGADHRLSDRQWRLARRVHRAGRVRDPGRAGLRVAAAARDRGRPRQAESRTPARRRDRGASELRQRAVARVGDRVRDDGDFEHHLPVDDLRVAEDLRRAAAGCRDRAWKAGSARSGCPAASISPP